MTVRFSELFMKTVVWIEKVLMLNRHQKSVQTLNDFEVTTHEVIPIQLNKWRPIMWI